ncbi:MAG TPA: hypothetical protein VHZ02_00845, partial [Acidimicrobiales bacterium]|nr:hypothetical protein [Acidimicrobiales bacterium]
MYYAGQVGKRLPVPIFQAIADFAIFGILLLVERWIRSQAPTGPGADGAGARGGDVTAVTADRSLPPAGIVIGVAMVLWGIERFFDEYLWLTDPSHLGFILVETAGIALSVAGLIVLATRVGPFQRWRAGGSDAGEPAIASSDPGNVRGDGETEPPGNIPVARGAAQPVVEGWAPHRGG